MTDTNPLRDANALFGPYDAENYLTQVLGGTLGHAGELLKYTTMLQTNQYPPLVSVQNAVSALLADLPRLHLAVERIEILIGGAYNPEATTFYSGRQAELAEIEKRNRRAAARQMGEEER